MEWSACACVYIRIVFEHNYLKQFPAILYVLRLLKLKFYVFLTIRQKRFSNRTQNFCEFRMGILERKCVITNVFPSYIVPGSVSVSKSIDEFL